MAESSWPFDNADTSEAQYSYLARLIADTGVIGSPSSSDLKVYGDSSGMFVKVPGLPSFGIVRGFLYLNDSLLTKSIAAASSQQRVDTVVLRLDPAANNVSVQVKQGSAGSGAPALTQTETDVYEMPLADVTVRANATTIAAGDVTDRRFFSSNRWGSWTTSARPVGAREGKAGYNYTTKSPEYFDGSNWKSFSTTTTDAGQLTGGTIPTARLDYGVMAAFRGDRSVDAPTSNDIVNGDWNTVLQPGVYRVWAGNQNQNSPASRFGDAYMYGTLVVFGAGNAIQSRTQTYYEHGNAGRTYTRTAWNGNDWNAWRWLASQEDLQSVASRVDNTYDKGAVDAAFRQRDLNIDGANSNANNRTLNRGNAALLVSGAGTVNNFTKDSTTNNYIGTLDIGVGGFNQVIAVGVTPNSADSGGVTGQVTNQSNTGFRAVITRRNNASTYFYWWAIGN